MPSKSKAKGNRFERLLVEKAKEAGLDAVRAWGSNGKSLGLHEEVDCIIQNMKVQAKCRAKIADYFKPSANVDVQIIKEDRGEPFVVMRFSDWLRRLHDD